jgi:ABC-type multidrug transport system fused ATPase/permease subunit
MYDARSLTRIYSDMASRLVMQQHRQNVMLSRITARTALSRELVDFFEQDLSVVLEALASLFGALIMLAWYDLTLIPCCVALFLPLTIGNRIYRRWLADKHRRLHDQLEKEVEIIEGGKAPEVKEHFGLLGRLRVRLADGEALHFGIMELFVLGLIIAAMARSCSVFGEHPGVIYAVFRYVMMFIMSLDSVPMLVQRISRVRDVCRRFES